MVVSRLLASVAAAFFAVALVAACDPGSRQDRFCAKLTKERALLGTVPANPGDLDDFVQRYRDLEKIAPLAIDEQWQTVTDLIVAVATEDLSDPATADRLRDRAVAATKAVNEVRLYAQHTCGVDLVLLNTAPPAPAGGVPPTTVVATLPPTVP
jgi:hypothetical protein